MCTLQVKQNMANNRRNRLIMWTPSKKRVRNQAEVYLYYSTGRFHLSFRKRDN